MNFLEAVKSGRQLRVAGYPGWFQFRPAKVGGVVLQCEDGTYFIPYRDDILSDNWEIKEEIRSLTWSQIREAMQEASELPRIKKMLGFDD